MNFEDSLYQLKTNEDGKTIRVFNGSLSIVVSFANKSKFVVLVVNPSCSCTATKTAKVCNVLPSPISSARQAPKLELK
ncbi:hypothetical protein D3C84_1067710 [compost metagenome]